MEEKQLEEYLIDLKKPIEFARKRKWCAIITTLLFIMAGYTATIRVPETYSVSAILSVPTGVSIREFRSRVNRRAFDKDLAKTLDRLSTRVHLIRRSNLVRIELQHVAENEIEESKDNIYKIVAGLQKAYARELSTDANNIRIVETPHATKDTQPSMKLSLALAGIAGLYFGIVLGIIKDLTQKNKRRPNENTKTYKPS